MLHLRQAAELLGVSEMTVRRDIAEHPDQFAYFGGHIMSPAQVEGNTRYEIATAADSHAAAKREACVHAARHIRPDETIFVDCGTTLLHLIELIPDDCRVTAICYALNVAERLARPETIPFFELPAKMRAAWSFGLNGNGFGMQFHSLIALPVLLVAMTLIAATVSMRFARLGQSVTMILGGVLAGFLLYVVSVLVKAFGNAGFVPPFVVAWIPVVVAMFFGVTFLLYKEDG